MFTLSGAQLTLVNVAVEFEVRREIASDRWSLFEIRQAESVRLEKCSLTVRNASDQGGTYHPDAAFFRFRSGPGTINPAAGDSGTTPRRVSVSLVDCILRGEAVVLRVHDQVPLQFSWENGLLVTTERLLVVDGGERLPASSESVQLDLKHLTAVVRSGLCRFNQTVSGPRLLATQVTCANSILIGGSAAPLIEHADVPAAEPGGAPFAWNGDRNFYEGFASYWTVRRAGESGGAAEAMSFDAWRTQWGPQRENLPSANRVRWLRPPPAERPVHTHVLSDYGLDPSSTPANPALHAASDGSNAGFLTDRRLPALPTAPESVSSLPQPSRGERRVP